MTGRFAAAVAAVALVLAAAGAAAPQTAIAVSVDWATVTRTSRTVATTQHLANAWTVRSHPRNKALLQALRDLHTDDTRLQLWFSVPNQAVAALKPPTPTETFWDFRAMDAVVTDFFANTSGRRHVNFGTIPRWMFAVEPMSLPQAAGASFYDYTKGTSGAVLRDPSGKEFAAYQARIYQWYAKGGFTDENGKFHRSGHRFKIDYWGVMNEQNVENAIPVETYTRMYDETVAAIRAIDPAVQFMGPEIGEGLSNRWLRYFLDPKNHTPGALPLDWVSIHNYAMADNDPASWQSALFGARPGVSGYGEQLREIVKLRNELSPKTRIAIDELGTFNTGKGDITGWALASSDIAYDSIHPLYWVASGANWAADFITAENLGIEIVSMSQLYGGPTQSPSCSMLNWDSGRPNAHYRVLKLVVDHFGPGDRLVATKVNSFDIVAQAAETARGRKLILVNTANRSVAVSIGDGLRATAEVVDEVSGENPPRLQDVKDDVIVLAPFATALVSIE